MPAFVTKKVTLLMSAKRRDIVGAQERWPGFRILVPICAEAGWHHRSVCEAVLSTHPVHLDVLEEGKWVCDPDPSEVSPSLGRRKAWVLTIVLHPLIPQQTRGGAFPPTHPPHKPGSRNPVRAGDAPQVTQVEAEELGFKPGLWSPPRKTDSGWCLLRPHTKAPRSVLCCTVSRIPHKSPRTFSSLSPPPLLFCR